MSYTSLKRRFTVGSTVRVTNHRFPHLSGIRTVLVQQSNAIASGPCIDLNGNTVEQSWLHWPPAAEVRVTEDSGVPKIETLNRDGSVAITYELLEEVEK